MSLPPTYLASVGRIGEAYVLLAPVEDPLLSRYYAGVAALARSVVSASRNEEVGSKKYYQAALEKLAVWPSDKAVQNYFKNTQKALSQHLTWAGGSRRKLARS